jgi:hypothetical protein
MEYLVNFNDWVGLYLWFGLIAIIGIVTVCRWAMKISVSCKLVEEETPDD